MKAIKFFLIPISLLLAALFIFQAQVPERKPLKNLGVAPEFNLESSASRKFSSKELKDKVWVFNIFFTTCNGPCPISSAHLKKIYNNNSNFSLVSVSVDPKNDTAEKLLDYSNKLDVSSDRWHFLRAQMSEVKRLAESFYMDAMEHHGMVHSNRVILIDKQGAIRGTYLGTEKSDMEELARDIDSLI